MTRIFAALALATISATSTLRAQSVEGVVRDATSGSVVGAGFVILLGSDGKEIARTLADPEGRFTLRAPAAGRYRLRSERIGFRVVTSPAIDLARDQTLAYTLQISAVPVRLEEIRVAAETKCRVRPDESRATATIWDEARKALTAVAWMQTQRRLRVRLRTYERDLDLQMKVVREASSVQSGLAVRAFRAAPPGQLAARGYIEKTSDGGLLFQGPDADVLFSDEFLNRHCFRLEPPGEGSEGLVGLGFAPVSSTRLPDISGVIWLDEKSAELRYVDFRYENHGLGVNTDLAGGRVEFEQLTNGGWIVRRYWIRMPQVALVRQQRGGGGIRDLGVMETHPEVAGVKEQGGEVLEAFATDGSRITASSGAATVAGSVFDSTRSVPLIGAEVRLSGTPYSAVSGPGGEFQIEGLPEGNYSVEFSHRDFPAWGVLPGPSVITLQRGSVTRVAVAVPSPRNLFRLICPEVKGDSLGAVAGLVRDSGSLRAVRDAVVQLSWLDYGVTLGEQISARKLGVEVGSDAGGYFRACNVPVGVPVEARVYIRGEEVGAATGFRVRPGQVFELVLP